MVFLLLTDQPKLCIFSIVSFSAEQVTCSRAGQGRELGGAAGVIGEQFIDIYCVRQILVITGFDCWEISLLAAAQ